MSEGEWRHILHYVSFDFAFCLKDLLGCIVCLTFSLLPFGVSLSE